MEEEEAGGAVGDWVRGTTKWWCQPPPVSGKRKVAAFSSSPSKRDLRRVLVSAKDALKKMEMKTRIRRKKEREPRYIWHV